MPFYVDDSCISCGLCTQLAEDIFQFGEDGKAEAISQEEDLDAEEAMESCPVDAIHKK